MGQLDKRRLVVAAVGFTAGIAIAMVGVYMFSIEVGLILTGLAVSGAFLYAVRLDRGDAE